MHLGIQLINLMTEVLNSAVFVILGISLARILVSHSQILFGSLTWLIVSDAEVRDKQLAQIRYDMVMVGIKSLEAESLSPTVKASVIYGLQDQIRKNTLGSFFKQWHTFTANKAGMTSLQSVEQRHALMHAFDAERKYLSNLEKKNLARADDVYEIYSKILLVESLFLDPQNQML